MNYAVDFKKIVTQTLPPHKRRPLRVLLLTKLLSFIQLVHNGFVTHANNVREEVSWNGQKILLERYLNIKYGAGITITNQDFSAQVIFLSDAPSESNILIGDCPDYLNPIIADSATGSLLTSGFTVNVPAGLNADLNEIRAVVEFYLIGSSSFEVVEI